MVSIEIDFDVYKALTSLRQSEEDSYGDVIRRLLSAYRPDAPTVSAPKPDSAWVYKNVAIPVGSELRARHKGRIYHALIRKDGLYVGDTPANSPSEAAFIVTKTSVNGWNFWEIKLPGSDLWRSLASLRIDSKG